MQLTMALTDTHMVSWTIN
jgi:hypothetical protein